tara:strand:+ start:1825 stop:2253 length:429 start_codon:yes stop_codon:yes gene_type:complete
MNTSDCCGASIIHHDICIECGEHCDSRDDVVSSDTSDIRQEELETSTFYENMYPASNPTEDKIKLLLVIRGYKRRNIHFRKDNINLQKSLRLGYWEQVKSKDIDYVITNMNKPIKIKEWYVHDDDCGWKYSYSLNYGVQNGI